MQYLKANLSQIICKFIRNIFYEQLKGQIHYIRPFQSTLIERSIKKPKLRLQSKLSIFFLVEQLSLSSLSVGPEQSSPFAYDLRYHWTLWFHQIEQHYHTNPEIWKWPEVKNTVIKIEYLLYLSNINIALHNWIISALMNSSTFHSNQCWLKRSFWCPEAFISNSNDLEIKCL